MIWDFAEANPFGGSVGDWRSMVDGAVNGLADLIMNGGRTLRRVQTGHIQAYLFGALGGAIVFVILQYVIR